jgi:signal transduction histidine kinase
VHPAWWLLAGLTAGLVATIAVAVVAARRADRRARASERRARNAEHLAYVGTLTGGLAHEIRNPLSTLTLNLQLLREDLNRPGTSVDPQVLRKLDAIEEESRRLQQTLDDFLKLAGKHAVNRQVRPLNPVLEEVAEFYRERLERAGVRLRTGLADGLPDVAFDADLLKQAVANLVLNAEAAMPQGGELILSTQPDRGGALVQVTDTGVGIPEKDLDKIFAPYYSTKKGGTGLGLPTVRRIVQEHDATLDVHSEVGRGTRFTIRLPAAGKPAQQASRP